MGAEAMKTGLNIEGIMDRRTTIDGVHQSCYRVYAIHEWLLQALRAGVPGDVAVEIAEELASFTRLEESRKALK